MASSKPTWLLGYRLGSLPALEKPGIEETYKRIRNKLRRYSATSLVELAFRVLWTPYGSRADELRSTPWHTLLLLKWALHDKEVHLRIGPSIPHAVLDQMRQELWSAQDLHHDEKSEPNIWLMLRTLLHVQAEFQRPVSWRFLRWPALYARLPTSHKSRRQFRDAIGIEPEPYLDLTYGLYAAILDGQMSLSSAWFQAWRPSFGEAVDRILELFCRDIAGWRDELQTDSSQRIRGRHELYEFPYFRKFPLFRGRDGQVRCWHRIVFARGVEDAVHLRMAEQFGKDYTDSFSKVFESYVIELAADANVPLLTETEYKAIVGRDASSVEAILEGADCNIFVEAKMALFSDDVLLQDNEESAFYKTKRVRDAIDQAWRVGELIRTFDGFGTRFQKREDFLLVVTSRELLIASGVALERLLPPGRLDYPVDAARQRLPLSNVFILSIDSFERLVGCLKAGEVQLAELLPRAALANQRADTSRLFFEDFLRQYTERWTEPKLLLDARMAAERRINTAFGADRL